ncbi:recombinase family protein [Ruegeria profundi]|uniref:recombinase family protein n=1 Tax=Ruegeria profundi TaxID=1685378 RepID=UPI0009EA7BEA|nr:recombinase family protein [Ruegeria profundi]
MTRTAIYARYSTDLQRDASIEDQIRVCEKHVQASGGQVYQSYTDHAVSGASLMRPGIQMLMQDAAAGRFDEVYAEALDRISRDQEDIAAVYKRLTFAGVKLVTHAEGEINELHIGLKGTMNALFLSDLRKKTHRGLVGKVEKGLSGGGKCFGYDVVHGEERGHRTINEDQASIVRRIFEDYAAGKSPKAIAAQLNKEGIAGPTGKAWGQSSINGNRQRGTGILNNELYIGRLIWNRLTYMKNPETGKRVSKLNPEEDWIIHEVPELRIIEDQLWEKVKERQAGLTRKNELWQTNRPRNLFAYLIKCGVCGGGCSTVSTGRIGCSNARNKGTCDNRQTVKREYVEEAVLGSLREHLMDEELCKVFCEEYTRHMNELTKRHNASLHQFERELEKLTREKKKIVQSIFDGVPGEFLKEDAQRIDSRMKQLTMLLEDKTERPVIFEPGIAARYKREVARLIDRLNSNEHREEAAELIRSLVDRIVLTPSQDRDRPIIDLEGDLAGILSVAAGVGKSTLSGDLSEFNPDECEALVAGAGFEPATFRL